MDGCRKMRFFCDVVGMDEISSTSIYNANLKVKKKWEAHATLIC